jgi:hypothetical protein
MDKTQTFTMRPLDPLAVLFNVLFLGIGTSFLYIGVTHDWRWGLPFAAIPFGLFFLYAAATQALSYIRVNATGLTILQTWPKKPNSRWPIWPKTRTIAFADIAKASIQAVWTPAGRGGGWRATLCLTMNDASKVYVALSPYRKSDCRGLVMSMRSHSVKVVVLQELLGKNFPAKG